MFTPRNLVIAGLALIAVSAVSITTNSVHVFWVLMGLAWVLGPQRCGSGRRRCGGGRRHLHRHDRSRPWAGDQRPYPSRDGAPTEPAPDPSRDHHVAFPTGH